ncbi:hypothetical protein K8R47_02410 [archaeon]|nr:hypothetical protein [archaeon]
MLENKRGQVTIFIILGIVVLAVIFLVFYYWGQSLTEPEQPTFEPSDISNFKNYVEDCIEKESVDDIKLIGKQGGTLNPTLFQYWYGNNLNYLCYTNNFGPCYNYAFKIERNIEEELDQILLTKITQCVDELISQAESEGFNANKGNPQIQTTIGDTKIIIEFYYPITLTKDTTSITEEIFSYSFNIPLGKMLDITREIIEEESNTNNFFNVPVSLSTISSPGGLITIEKQTYEDTKIYILKSTKTGYVFQFAIKGWVY